VNCELPGSFRSHCTRLPEKHQARRNRIGFRNTYTYVGMPASSSPSGWIDSSRRRTELWLKHRKGRSVATDNGYTRSNS
jgi:hypothetical protein